jgi:hypothetical protein
VRTTPASICAHRSLTMLPLHGRDLYREGVGRKETGFDSCVVFFLPDVLALAAFVSVRKNVESQEEMYWSRIAELLLSKT